MHNQTDTIFALSTAPGTAGIAVVRVSGALAATALTQLSGSDTALPTPRTAIRRHLRHHTTGEAIDHALVLYFMAPASFTGEDVVELHIHGGIAVINALLAALGEMDGLRAAEPGEFTRRAFDNNRIDLTQAEGLADVINAETELQLRLALSHADGTYRKLFAAWRKQIITAQALVESGIDFSDEADVAADVTLQAQKIAADLCSEIAQSLENAHRGEIMRDGYRVVLLGPPNSGKSSLLNTLAGRDAAIVTSQAGTTRDIIEVKMNLAGLPVIISDTAGIRATAEEIEREGVRRSLERANSANLVIWLQDVTEPAAPNSPNLEDQTTELISVTTKIDLAHAQSGAATDHRANLEISTVTGQGIDNLIKLIVGRTRANLKSSEPTAIARQRHRTHLTQCHDALLRFLKHQVVDPRSDNLELRAEDLRSAAMAMGRLTGHIDVEHVLDQIFSEFCIGK